MALIALNVLVYGITAVQSRSLVSNESGSTLFTDWVLYGPAVAHGQFERLLGSGFLHYGPMHLLVNMLALYLFGRDCEVFFGRWRFLAIYLLSLLGGAATVLALQPLALTAGASGAIYGLFGATLMVVLRLRRNPTSLLVLLALNFMLSISLPGISLWGHLGGLIAGSAVAAGFLYLRNQRQGWMVAGAVALAIVALIVVRTIELRDVVSVIH